MKKTIQKFALVVLTLSTAFFSCKKDNDTATIAPIDDTATSTVSRTIVYVLNQGGLGLNNSTISKYDGTSTGTIDNDYFNTKNNRKLGDTGNDLQIYGNYMYCITNVSGQLEIMNSDDATVVKTIALGDGTSSGGPRNIAFSGNYGYVSSYNETVYKIDLSTQALVASITVGLDPEDLCVTNDKLYVSNSGGFQSTPDNRISVIDLNTFKITSTITVGNNPGQIETDSNGNVYVMCTSYDASWNQITTIYKIDSNNAVTTLSGFSANVLNFVIYNNRMYANCKDKNVNVYNLSTHQLEKTNFITDMGGYSFVAAYGLPIFIDSNTGNVYLCDAGNNSDTGWVYCFNSSGVFQYRKSVGVTPSKMVFLSK